MGKNKRRVFQCFDNIHNVNLEVDSQEEKDFLYWVCTAVKLNIIKDFIYQPPSYQLCDGIDYINVDNKKRCLFRDHIYTPDFKLIFNAKKYIDLSREFKISIDKLNEQFEQFIDIKGSFSRSGGDRSFSMNQKWVYDKHKIYVYKLIPQDFFKKFGVPEECRLTEKTKKPSKKYEGFKSIKECFNIS